MVILMTNTIASMNSSSISLGSMSLVRLNSNDLEKVRVWRNSEHVVKTMIYKKNISKEEQVKWFYSLNENSEYYYIINYKKFPVGLANIKNLTKEYPEAGVFIGEKEFDGLGLAFAAVYLLNSFAFKKLNIEKLYATILNNNLAAIKFNKSLGYKVKEEGVETGFYELTKEDFFNNENKIFNLIKRVL